MFTVMNLGVLQKVFFFLGGGGGGGGSDIFFFFFFFQQGGGWWCAVISSYPIYFCSTDPEGGCDPQDIEHVSYI